MESISIRSRESVVSCEVDRFWLVGFTDLFIFLIGLEISGLFTRLGGWGVFGGVGTVLLGESKLGIFCWGICVISKFGLLFWGSKFGIGERGGELIIVGEEKELLVLT